MGVTAHPSAEWIARQLTEACGWSEQPRYVIRDRDGTYGEAFIRRLTAMGIRDRPISSSPFAQLLARILSRTHLSLKKHAPIPRDVQSAGRVLALPILGGLHHRYVRV